MTGACDVAVIAGGVGAARFLRAMHTFDAALSVTAIVNTGDDAAINGLHVSPDIDTVIYTLAGAIDPQRGWGLVDETWTTMQSLARYATVQPVGSQAPNDWFNLGNRDLATHLYRTARLGEGASLSQVTREIASAWNVSCNVVPMTDARVETRVVLRDDATTTSGHGYRAGEEISFQEYFVRLRHDVPVARLHFDGSDVARPNGLDTLADAAMIVIAPSNPLVSIGPIRALRGVDAGLVARRESVVAISPIIAGSALKGPADRMMGELGHEPTALGVARLYRDICGTMVVDTADANLQSDIEALDMRCIVTDTIMREPRVARALAATIAGLRRS